MNRSDPFGSKQHCRIALFPQEKSGPLGRFKEARDGGNKSGKAMQDEVGSETQTLELGESTILEEDYIHLIYDLF
jgi:hypothetical protein